MTEEERVARAVAESLVACGVLRKAVNDPWVVGPSILIARAAIRAMRDAAPPGDDTEPLHSAVLY